MSYWDNTGKYQDLYNQYAALLEGKEYCVEPSLEFLRVVREAYHETHNNGGVNLSCYNQLYRVMDNGLLTVWTHMQSIDSWWEIMDSCNEILFEGVCLTNLWGLAEINRFEDLLEDLMDAALKHCERNYEFEQSYGHPIEALAAA